VEGWKVKTGNSIGSKGPGTTCVYDPTPLPSALPTPRPTSLPSFVPTVSCADGTYLSESGECEDCAFGKYSNNSNGPPWVDACKLCPHGRISLVMGGSLRNCTACDEGKLSSAERTSCGDCPAGNYVKDQKSCEDCVEGTFAPSAQTDACLDCDSGSSTGVRIRATECTACDGGRYSKGLQTNCSECEAGKYSGSRAEFCTNCTIGKYSDTAKSTTCSSCDIGYYQANAGAITCDACPAGSFSSSTGEHICDECGMGRYSSFSNSSSCSDCQSGKYQSSTGETSCLVCPAGKYSDQTAARTCLPCLSGSYSGAQSSSCSKCEAGKFQIRNKSTSCDDCPEGTYMRSSGSYECEPCAPGSFSQNSSSVSCSKCTERGPQYTSTLGATVCDLCESHYYMDKHMVCVQKPVGVRLSPDSTLKNLELYEGYFRFSTSTAHIYACPSSLNCTGGKLSSNSSLKSSSLCRKGSFGPLCSICAGDYFLSETLGCIECSLGNGWIGPLVFFILLVCVLLVVGKYFDRILAFRRKHKKILAEYGQRGTAVFVCMQIIIVLNTTHKNVGGKPVPNPYRDFMDFLSFMQLDVVKLVPFDCMYESSFDHLDALLLESLVPLVFLAFALGGAELMQRRSVGTKNAHVFSLFMHLLFFVLPIISRKICQSFRCQPYDAGDEATHSYLVADTSMDCFSDRYWGMFVYACIMLLIYPIGAPLTLLIMLWKLREHVNPKSPGLRVHEIDAQRRLDTNRARQPQPPTDPTTTPTTFLTTIVTTKPFSEKPEVANEPIAFFALYYRPKFWFWETLNMSKRLLLTCAVVMCRTLAQTTVFVLFVTIISLVVEREAKPYLNPFLSAFTYILSWQMVMFVLYLLLLDADVSGATSANFHLQS